MLIMKTDIPHDIKSAYFNAFGGSGRAIVQDLPFVPEI